MTSRAVVRKKDVNPLHEYGAHPIIRSLYIRMSRTNFPDRIASVG